MCIALAVAREDRCGMDQQLPLCRGVAFFLIEAEFAELKVPEIAPHIRNLGRDIKTDFAAFCLNGKIFCGKRKCGTEQANYKEGTHEHRLGDKVGVYTGI